MDTDTDLEFLQHLFKRFVPAKINTKSNTRRSSKQPIFEGWLDITEKESIELANHVIYKDGPFMFLTGEKTAFMTFDLDRKDETRKDHVVKVDGVEYWNDKYQQEEKNTLIIKTPSGGYHLVYKYSKGVKSGQLEKDVLIDILSDGKGMCFGPGYQILNKTEPVSPPASLIQQITINQQNVFNSQIIYNTNKQIRDCSSTINDISGCDYVWDVLKSPDGNAYTLIPHTNICTVNERHTHSEAKHSRFVVTNKAVVAKCFSHAINRVVTGKASEQLRAYFFPDNPDSFESFMQTMFDVCKKELLGRMKGYVWKSNSTSPWQYEKVGTYTQFLNSYFAGTHVFVKHPKKFSEVLKYIEEIANPIFPFLETHLDYIGFDNGVLNIATFEFSTDWIHGYMPRHNIKQSFSWDILHAPLFDGLLQYQVGDGEIYRYLLAFIGRLLFPLKRFDNYNLLPVIKGDTGTGKSTVLEVIKHMFAPGCNKHEPRNHIRLGK